jgi:hypothetical protein
MKELIPTKLIIDVNEAGTIAGAILQYKINDNGAISKLKSVSVIGSLTAEDVNTIIADAKESAETSEGVSA